MLMNQIRTDVENWNKELKKRENLKKEGINNLENSERRVSNPRINVEDLECRVAKILENGDIKNVEDWSINLSSWKVFWM